MRRVLAFLLAPFPAALFQSIVVAWWPKPGLGVFEHPLSMFIAICLLFYISALVIGTPLFLLVRKRMTPNLQNYALIAMSAVLVPILAGLGSMIVRGQGSAYIIVYNLMFFGLGGLSAGALFWLLERPDRRGSA